MLATTAEDRRWEKAFNYILFQPERWKFRTIGYISDLFQNTINCFNLIDLLAVW